MADLYYEAKFSNQALGITHSKPRASKHDWQYTRGQAKPPSGRSTLSYACILVNVVVEILLNCNIISDYKK